MADTRGGVERAKRSIISMLNRQPRPKQAEIAAATGLSQGYVSKLCRGRFAEISPGVEKLLEYSKRRYVPEASDQAANEAAAARLCKALARLTSADPALGDEAARFINAIADRLGRS